MERHFRDREIAEAFGVSRNTVWRWVREGRLPEPVRISPGCTRWPQSDIDQLTQRKGK
jgi:prophage regulatory protein